MTRNIDFTINNKQNVFNRKRYNKGEHFNINDYIINENGTIFSKRNNIYLKPHRRTDGYYTIRINKKDYPIHRLVAEKYIPNPNNYPYINHKDKNKTNNTVENLEWCTPKQNSIHGIGKKVYQYDLNGNLIKVYNAITEIDGKRFNHKMIANHCRKNNCIHKYFIFSYIALNKDDIIDIVSKSKWYAKR